MVKTSLTDYPLVSVVLVSYNSSKYIIETLESIKSQTYENIELIVSDDCSTDNTLEICNNWINTNRDRFFDAQIFKMNFNTGVSANCNRGLNLANGKWLKFIGGDDCLMSDCIENYINYVNLNSSAFIIQSDIAKYKNDFQEENFIAVRSLKNNPITLPNISPKDQYKILLRGCYVNSPSTFLQKEILLSIGGFDEQIKMIEDWPLWLNLSKNNIKIHYMPEITVKYRVRIDSISNERINNNLFNTHLDREHEIFLKYLSPDLSILERYSKLYLFSKYLIFTKLRLDSKTHFNLILNAFFSYPMMWLHKLIFKLIKLKIVIKYKF